jgi:hypothetical protein
MAQRHPHLAQMDYYLLHQVEAVLRPAQSKFSTSMIMASQNAAQASTEFGHNCYGSSSHHRATIEPPSSHHRAII